MQRTCQQAKPPHTAVVAHTCNAQTYVIWHHLHVDRHSMYTHARMHARQSTDEVAIVPLPRRCRLALSSITAATPPSSILWAVAR
mmetsp:Transcript_20085/g.55141  ORF Transcript_20085/g.55141 Transcript_20085/m.55141 type:complete len:85 (-) Transcript_20085:880-1134(-)